jgi:hypothetical protein
MDLILDQSVDGDRGIATPGEVVSVARDQTRRPIFQDIGMLHALRGSAENIAEALIERTKRDPTLGKALAGRFLEVGAGLAPLSLALARLFPTAHFTAIDSDNNAVMVARRHIAASDFSARFVVSLRDVIHVDERASYAAAWAPAPFLPRQGARMAFDRLTLALQPRGFLIIANAPRGESDASVATNAAQRLRSNGNIWRTEDLAALLREQGYREINCLPCPNGVELLIARRP